MTAMGMLGSISYMSVSRAKPLDKLSSVKPLTSIFHPSLFISLLGQFAVHLVTMMWATNTAKQYLEDDYKVDLDGEFKPGINRHGIKNIPRLKSHRFNCGSCQVSSRGTTR